MTLSAPARPAAAAVSNAARPMAPIPILYLNPHGDRAGAERMLDAVIRGHRDAEPQRFEPRVICGTEGEFSRGLRDAGIPVDIHPMRYRSLPGDVAWLRGLIKRHGVRLVHTTMAHYHQFAWLAARGLGAKCLWFNHGPCSPRRWKGIAHAFPADATLVMSEFLGRDHAGWTLAPPPRLVYLGLEEHWFKPRPDLRAAWRSKLGLGENDVALGLLGRLEPLKRQDDFLRAFAEIPPAAAARARVFIGGRPSACEEGRAYAERLRAEAAAHPHASRIHLLDYVEAEPFWEAMDVAVNWSIYETFSMAALEALAKGKLVISSRVGGVPEFLKDGFNGVLIEPLDSAGLSRTLEAVLASPESFEVIRAAARDSVRDRFAAKRVQSELESLYFDLLGIPAPEAN